MMQKVGVLYNARVPHVTPFVWISLAFAGRCEICWMRDNPFKLHVMGECGVNEGCLAWLLDVCTGGGVRGGEASIQEYSWSHAGG